MSAVQRLLGQPKDLGGGFTVRRMLPDAQRQSVGPFLFFDHFGPVTVMPDAQHDVRPHPHIGLATVTYLFSGAILHRDSLGHVQQIEPGAINWMTAGRGIVHSERRPDSLKNLAHVNHGIQLWAALPQPHEDTEPAFAHTPESALPQVRVGDAMVRVLVGEAFGAASPVATYSRTLYLDVQLPARATLDIAALVPEMAVYAVDSAVECQGEPLPKHTLAVLPSGQSTRVTAGDTAARLMVIGGDALDGHRYIWWNFVSSRKERIVQAAADWDSQALGEVPGEVEWIPLPERRFKV
jgi:redox-sensitive bicupin YhaK (pirin superfamily)